MASITELRYVRVRAHSSFLWRQTANVWGEVHVVFISVVWMTYAWFYLRMICHFLNENDTPRNFRWVKSQSCFPSIVHHTNAAFVLTNASSAIMFICSCCLFKRNAKKTSLYFQYRFSTYFQFLDGWIFVFRTWCHTGKTISMQEKQYFFMLVMLCKLNWL